MESTTKSVAALLGCGLVLIAFVSGCGAASSNTGSASQSTGPSREFMKKGGNNRPATFGEPASERETQEAARVLKTNLEARASGKWRKQCATLSRSAISRIEADAPNFGAGKGCVNGLSAEAKPLSQTKSIRADTLTGTIAVLRVKGNEGYALYHGAHGKDYAMEMEKEGGEWKVARLATTEVP